jgi:hypothetical protein
MNTYFLLNDLHINIKVIVRYKTCFNLSETIKPPWHRNNLSTVSYFYFVDKHHKVKFFSQMTWHHLSLTKTILLVEWMYFEHNSQQGSLKGFESKLGDCYLIEDQGWRLRRLIIKLENCNCIVFSYLSINSLIIFEIRVSIPLFWNWGWYTGQAMTRNSRTP